MSTCFVSNPTLWESILPPGRRGLRPATPLGPPGLAVRTPAAGGTAPAAGGSGGARPGRGGLSAAVRRRLAAQGEGGGGGRL